MEAPSASLPQIATTSRQIAHRLLTIVQNRLDLLVVELQEERERVLQSILLALGSAAFGLLAGVALTVVILFVFWEVSPLVASLVLFSLYAATAVLFYIRLKRLQRDWQTFPATLDQLRKDCECLENTLA